MIYTYTKRINKQMNDLIIHRVEHIVKQTDVKVKIQHMQSNAFTYQEQSKQIRRRENFEKAKKKKSRR